MDNQCASLTIKKISPDDENNYIIRVRNDHGEVDESVSLLVMSK